MARDDSFAEFILDQLEDLPDVECRAMFGGYGLYHDEIFFGIVFKGRLYFKTNEKSAAFYRRRGMKAFRPSAKQRLKSYYEVPARCSKIATRSPNGRGRRSGSRASAQTAVVSASGEMAAFAVLPFRYSRR